MQSQDITVKIKFLTDKVYEVEISPTETVETLKALIYEVTDVPPQDQKLIFRGTILKDNQVLSEAKFENGCNVHLVRTKISNPEQANSSPPKTTTTSTNNTTNRPQNSNVPIGMNSGGFGLLNQFGYAGNPNASQNNQMANLFKSDYFKNMMESIMSNPEALQAMVNMNPMLKEMVDKDPEILQAMSSPMMRQMLNDPDVMNSAMGMMDRMKTNPYGSMMGSAGSFPAPGGSGLPSNSESDKKEEKTEKTEDKPKTTTQNTQGNNNNNTQNPMGGFNPFGGFGGFNPMMNLFGNMNLNQNNSNQQPNTNNNNNSNQQQQQNRPFVNPFMMNPNFYQNMMNQMGGLGNLYGNLGGNPLSNLTDNRPPEEKYKTQLEHMEAMGFTNKQVNIEALKATNGLVDAAIERILNMIDK